MSKRLHKKNRHLPVVRTGELATWERRNHMGGVTTEVVDRDATGKAYIKRHRAALECVLDFYLRTRRINEAQHAAGIRLRELYTRVDHGFDSTNLGGALPVDGGHRDHEKRVALYLDFLNQLKRTYAELTPTQRTILRDVCGFDLYAKSKDDKETLARGLDRLAIYWSIMKPAQ